MNWYMVQTGMAQYGTKQRVSNMKERNKKDEDN